MSKAMLSPKKFRTRAIASAAVAMPLVAAGLLAAPSAQADQIWYQSVGRASATSTCQEPNANEAADGWSAWVGSWEQWMNAGNGGYTCTRSLTWARNSADTVPIAGAGCVLADTGAPQSYVFFDSQNFLAANAPSYTDAACTSINSLFLVALAYGVNQVAADSICVARLQGTNAAAQSWTAPNVYVCAI